MAGPTAGAVGSTVRGSAGSTEEQRNENGHTNTRDCVLPVGVASLGFIFLNIHSRRVEELKQ
jgi:hypothetical protein